MGHPWHWWTNVPEAARWSDDDSLHAYANMTNQTSLHIQLTASACAGNSLQSVSVMEIDATPRPSCFWVIGLRHHQKVRSIREKGEIGVE